MKAVEPMNMGSQPNGVTKADGRRLAWRSVGKGPLLLLINGYAAAAGNWDPRFLGSLTQAFRVICPDNRGIGGSVPGELGALTIEGMAADLEAVLDALEVERTLVAGWSMGGFIAQRLAARAPERVEAMALLSTDPGGSAATLGDPEAWTRLFNLSGTPGEQVARLISVLFPPSVAPAVERKLGEAMADVRSHLAPGVLTAQERAIAAWHVEDQPPPPANSPPVLIAHGAEDILIPAANASALAARWPRAQVEILPGGGHAFMAQYPDRVAELIAGFGHAPH